jgi:hypothetical protein
MYELKIDIACTISKDIAVSRSARPSENGDTAPTSSHYANRDRHQRTWGEISRANGYNNRICGKDERAPLSILYP